MGETVTSYSRTRTAGKTTFLVVFCVGFLILSGIVDFCIFGLINVKHRQKMIADGNTATAEIYACTQDRANSPWFCTYRYFDESGTEYRGILALPYYKTSEEAERHIGEKIEIYIDGKGDSFPVGEEPDIGYAITWVIISIVLVCADTVGIAITSVRIRKERQKRARTK